MRFARLGGMSNRTPLKLPRVQPHLVYYAELSGDQLPGDIHFPRRNRWAGQKKPWEAGEMEKEGRGKKGWPGVGLVLLSGGVLVLGWSGGFLLRS